MIRRWLRRVGTVLLSIVFLWGAVLGFANPLNCTWPSMVELTSSGAPAPTDVALELGAHAAAQLEEAVARTIVQRGSSYYRFVPERDFIEHALLGSPRVWQYVGDQLTRVDKSAASLAMRANDDYATATAKANAGLYPRLFQFAVLYAKPNHACVIITTAQAYDNMNDFVFWQVFRPVFGLGPWVAFPQGGIFFGW